MRRGTVIETLMDRVPNKIVEVTEGSIARRSVRGKSHERKVTRRQVERLWEELHGGRDWHGKVLVFTRALVARAAPDLVRTTADGDIALHERLLRRQG